MSTRCEIQAANFAQAVKNLIPGMELDVPFWDRETCHAKGYRNAEAGVVLESTPFSAEDAFSVESTDGFGTFKLEGVPVFKGIHAEPYASYLLLWYQD